MYQWSTKTETCCEVTCLFTSIKVLVVLTDLSIPYRYYEAVSKEEG
jgi:hypothetical protein